MVRKIHGTSSAARSGAEERLSEPPAHQRGAGEAEGDGHADVAEVEERRVDDHQDVVLQQRIRARAVERRVGHGRNGLAGPAMQEGEERRRSASHGADGARHVLVVLVAREPAWRQRCRCRG